VEAPLHFEYVPGISGRLCPASQFRWARASSRQPCFPGAQRRGTGGNRRLWDNLHRSNGTRGTRRHRYRLASRTIPLI
jgi:hypothetical protein